MIYNFCCSDRFRHNNRLENYPLSRNVDVVFPDRTIRSYVEVAGLLTNQASGTISLLSRLYCSGKEEMCWGTIVLF